MASLIDIAEPTDPRLGDYVGLTDVTRRRGFEPVAGGEHGIFIAEGDLVVRRALDAGYLIRSLLLDPKRVGQLGDVVDAHDVPAYVASPAVLTAVTGFHVHRGVLASFDRKPPLTVGDVLATARCVLICEGLTSTTNLGAILRSAAALGIDGVLLSPDCCDPLYRRAVRVSMGESLRLPIARIDPWPGAVADIRAAGVTTVALTPDVSASSLEDVVSGLGADARIALLVGEEGPGLSDEAFAVADVRARIPMAPGVDSLNVAAAAAIACYVVGTP